MPSLRSIRKGISLFARPSFLLAMLRYRVAAASEHLQAIGYCSANTLIDAGANKGQFSLAFRSIRPQARIVAFEPLPEAADTFEKLFASDNNSEVFRIALGASEGRADFHVADRPDSSSLLKPGEQQAQAFNVHPATTMTVAVRRLDECIDLRALRSPVFLKVDVQGGELGVFEGCVDMSNIDFVYVELSFVELYEGQPLFQEVSDYLTARGFRIQGLFNQVVTKDFGPTQVDVLFKRVSN